MTRSIRKSVTFLLSVIFVIQLIAFPVLADSVTEVTGSGTYEDPTVTVTTTTETVGTSTEVARETVIEGSSGSPLTPEGASSIYSEEEHLQECWSADGVNYKRGQGTSKTTITQNETTETRPVVIAESPSIIVTDTTYDEDRSTTDTDIIENNDYYYEGWETVSTAGGGPVSAELTPGSNSREAHPVDPASLIPQSSVGQIKENQDPSGRVISYTLTTAEDLGTTEASQTVEGDTRELNGPEVIESQNTTTETTVSNKEVTPPAPDPVTTSADGGTVTQTVDPIVKDGKTVGYTVTTVYTSGDTTGGSTKKETYMGQYTESKKETTTTVTKKDVSETDVTRIDTVSSKSRITEKTWRPDGQQANRTLYAEMGNVEALEGQGKKDVQTLKPDLEGVPQDAIGEDGLFVKGYEGIEDNERNGHLADACQYVLVKKPCLGSAYTVAANEGQSHYDPWQFVLRDKEDDTDLHYAYCADMEVPPQYGTHYNMVNVNDAGYYNDEQAKMVQRIAYNGYWGTESGLGSLQSLQQTLLDHRDQTALTEEEIQGLTGGEALTATQAALWKYGNSGSKELFHSRISMTKKPGPTEPYQIVNEPEAQNRIQKVYEFLIDQNTDLPAQSTKLLGKNSISGAVIDVGRKNGDKYQTDLSFRLADTVNHVNDDLIVTVLDKDQNPIAQKRLAGAPQDGETMDALTAGADGLYKISGLQLLNGQEVTLKLSGTQKLDRGVYLYSAPGGTENYNLSQTFIGVGEGHQDVNLSVGLQYHVDEEDQRFNVLTEIYDREVINTTETPGTARVCETRTKTEVAETVRKYDQMVRTTEQEFNYQYPAAPTGGDDPNPNYDPDPGTGTPSKPSPDPKAKKDQTADKEKDPEKKPEEKPAAPVPAPATADGSGIWFAALLASMLGILMMLPMAAAPFKKQLCTGAAADAMTLSGSADDNEDEALTASVQNRISRKFSRKPGTASYRRTKTDPRRHPPF